MHFRYTTAVPFVLNGSFQGSPPSFAATHHRKTWLEINEATPPFIPTPPFCQPDKDKKCNNGGGLVKM